MSERERERERVCVYVRACVLSRTTERLTEYTKAFFLSPAGPQKDNNHIHFFWKEVKLNISYRVQPRSIAVRDPVTTGLGLRPTSTQAITKTTSDFKLEATFDKYKRHFTD